MGSTLNAKIPPASTGERGQIMVEFILMAPLLLLLLLIIFELSLLWIDRHFMNLAAFDAARVMVQDGYTCENQEHSSVALSKARLRMASVAPSLPAVLAEFGLSLGGEPLAEGVNLGRFGDAIGHLLARYPAAWALTHMDCKERDGGVEVEITYYRSPKMPYVKHVFWMAYWVSKLNETSQELGTGDLVAFDMDRYFAGLEVSSPALDQLSQQIQTFRSQVLSALETAENLSLPIGDASALISQVGLGPFADPGHLDVASLKGRVDAFAEHAQGEISELTAGLSSYGKTIETLIYAVPEPLRLIPQKKSVFLRRPVHEDFGTEDWEDAQALLVAPFVGEGAGFDQWREWAKRMNQ